MTDELKIGYAKVDITPGESVPMAGLGNSSQRKSKGILDPVYATCLAVSDSEGSDALFFSLDIQNAYHPPVGSFRQAISDAAGIPQERIMLCFTHDHSSVDIANIEEPSILRYNPWLTERLVEIAVKALEDRRPAKMHTASVQTENLNFVRRYIMNDGSLCGDNFGSLESGIRCHETEADHTLQLIKFVRNGGDVIVTNFQTHSNYTIRDGRLSSDAAGAFRDALEALSGCKVIHFNGASGNINPKSRIPEENIATDHRDWGRRLAAYAMDAVYTRCPVAKLKTDRFVFSAKANHTQDHLLPIAQQISDVFYSTNDRSRCREMGLPYGITSAYHALAIIGNSRREETIPVHMFVFSLGDVAFAFAPIEMFDTNGMYIKAHSPFAMTFICGYANYCQGYMPSALACANSGYEVLTSIFAPDNAERLAETYVEMLKELKSEE